MPRRIAITNLNAKTIDILNTIRMNASQEYQSLVPAVAKETDIPKVGEVICGYPSMANQFLASLVNRIAMVKIKSATFNNAYAELKKGYLEFGETVEEVFVSIAKAREFSAEKAEAREFKRTLPDVRTAFHTMNWRVQYPVTVQQEDLQRAFLNAEGVTDLIAKIIDSVTTGAEYDEYLLFKYLIIKAVAHGKMKPIGVDTSSMSNLAKAFRGTSNSMEFLRRDFNAEGVLTSTPKADQYIFMDAQFNADYDVDVLASAFNMDKATFMGKLKLIDDFTSFDNERFDIIRQNSDQIEEVTAEELALMADVKAVLVDGEWFQIYDNLTNMTEAQVGSGIYWNYFYNTWKTVSSSPFSNAVVFIDNTADAGLEDSYAFKITDKSIGDATTIMTLELDDEATLAHMAYNFVQTSDAVQKGVAVHKYGAVIIPNTVSTTSMEVVIGGVHYTGTLTTASATGATVTFTKVA